MKKNFRNTLVGVVVLSLIAVCYAVSSKSESNNTVTDLVLANIEALADDEQGQMANACCPIWEVEIETSFPWPTTRCRTGGNYKCNNCNCPN